MARTSDMERKLLLCRGASNVRGRWRRTMKLSAILLVTATLPLAAQWLNYPDAQIPHKKDGKPNLTAPAPRRNGKPDISGVWQAERTPISEFTRVLGDNIAYLQD